MSAKNIIVQIGILSLVSGLTACTMGGLKSKQADNGYRSQKVVYHINDLNTAIGGLRNVQNHLDAVGDKNSEIIVLTHSSGAFALVDGSQDANGQAFESTVQQLASRGVKFEICGNTIRGKKIDKTKINLNAQVVPSGVARVIDLQQRGYNYIKP